MPDPYYGASNGFEHVLDLVEEAAIGVLDHLRNTQPPTPAPDSPSAAPDRGPRNRPADSTGAMREPPMRLQFTFSGGGRGSSVGAALRSGRGGSGSRSGRWLGSSGARAFMSGRASSGLSTGSER